MVLLHSSINPNLNEEDSLLSEAVFLQCAPYPGSLRGKGAIPIPARGLPGEKGAAQASMPRALPSYIQSFQGKFFQVL